MRRLLFVVAALGASVLVSTAAAVIVGTSGDAQKIPPPASVGVGALESDTTMFVFDEKQCTLLTSGVHVDITRPGKYNDKEDLKPGTIPAGTVVSSHFIHVDSKSGQPGDPVFFDGSITTDKDILGVAVLRGTLKNSDFLGAPGTSYPNKFRQVNFFVNDYVVWQANNRTVTAHFGNHLHTDHVRVITKCI